MITHALRASGACALGMATVTAALVAGSAGQHSSPGDCGPGTARDATWGRGERERKTMRTMTCVRRHADWLTALCLSTLLLTFWCPPGRTEHLGTDFAWMAGMKGRGNEACCAVLDCVE